jgi:hypothetical protein
MRGIADIFSSARRDVEKKVVEPQLAGEEIDYYEGALDETMYYVDMSSAFSDEASSEPEDESLYLLEYVVDDRSEASTEGDVSGVEYADDDAGGWSREDEAGGMEYFGEFPPGNGSSIRWDDFFSQREDESSDAQFSSSSILYDFDDDDDNEFSIFFEHESSGPGLPPSIPLPPLPTVPTTAAPAEGDEPKRLSGEALRNVMAFMHRSAGIGRDRRRNKGQEFDEEC